MITVTYDPNNKTEPLISDGEVDEMAEHIGIQVQALKENQHNLEYIVSNSLVIYEIRARIAEGKIDHSNIQFKFQDIILQPNKDGRLEYWPLGFCDKFEDCLHRLLK